MRGNGRSVVSATSTSKFPRARLLLPLDVSKTATAAFRATTRRRVMDVDARPSLDIITVHASPTIHTTIPQPHPVASRVYASPPSPPSNVFALPLKPNTIHSTFTGTTSNRLPVAVNPIYCFGIPHRENYNPISTEERETQTGSPTWWPLFTNHSSHLYAQARQSSSTQASRGSSRQSRIDCLHGMPTCHRRSLHFSMCHKNPASLSQNVESRSRLCSGVNWWSTTNKFFWTYTTNTK